MKTENWLRLTVVIFLPLLIIFAPYYVAHIGFIQHIYQPTSLMEFWLFGALCIFFISFAVTILFCFLKLLVGVIASIFYWIIEE